MGMEWRRVAQSGMEQRPKDGLAGFIGSSRAGIVGVLPFLRTVQSLVWFCTTKMSKSGSSGEGKLCSGTFQAAWASLR